MDHGLSVVDGVTGLTLHARRDLSSLKPGFGVVKLCVALSCEQ